VNNNGNGNRSLESLSEQAYEIARRRKAAANEVEALLEEQYDSAFGSHAASVLHAAAWLAGNSLRRSFGTDGSAAPQTAPRGDGAAEELKLMKAFIFLVDKYGIKVKPEDYAAEIPPEQRTRLSPQEIEAKFGRRYDELMQHHGFDYADAARTGAVVCARLVKLHCANRTDLEPQVAASIVSRGFVEGAQDSQTPPVE
jgi:hypothetical protein